jgi:NADH dehydrogenase (ubiquinone) 1 beta subcomplex subunit 9
MPLKLYMLTLIFSRSLYRRSLKLSLDWAVHRYLWRGQAMYIRSLFEANKNIKDPRQQRASHLGCRNGDVANEDAQALFQEAEAELEKWKHPDPYHAPTAPGG